MFSHARVDDVCPICLGVEGIENDKTLIRASDIVFRDDKTMVFIASYFIGNNPGHLIVVPLEHFENFYDIPDEIGAHLFSVARKMAIVMKQTYGCGGVMVLQNNEPASGQHAFHYHLHLFPRYDNDNIHLHMTNKRETRVEERLPYAEKIKQTQKQAI